MHFTYFSLYPVWIKAGIKLRVLSTLLLLTALVAGHCQAQTLASVAFAYRCAAADPIFPLNGADAGWKVMGETLLVAPKQRCWIRINRSSAPTNGERPGYLILQRSPLLEIAEFDARGIEIAQSHHDGSSFAAVEIGRRVMLSLANLNNGPLYLRIDSTNPVFQERVVNKGIAPLDQGVQTQQRVLTGTLFAATLLLTSALFTASFGFVLRDLDFGIYAIYTASLAATLCAWDQINFPLVGTGYGWLWQIANPISTVMLCWLAIRFGKFHKHSKFVSRLLILEMAVNLVLLFWSLLALVGIPMPVLPFDRFAFENWQDVVTGTLVIAGGWRGWRRGDPDCLILLLSLVPSMTSDLISRIWEPLVAPYLDSSFGLVLPDWINTLLHFNGSMTWIALPLVFCFAAARRAMTLQMTLVEERKRLEDRVLQRTHELHIVNKELELLATTDPLTGLPNRRSMMDWIKREIERSDRSNKPLALCMMDVDHFKKVNDTYGHPTGDSTIVAIARTCVETIRKTDIASRFGGEEFVILMPETDLEEAAKVTERLREAIEGLTFFSESNQAFSMTISIGVALFDHRQADDNISKLLNRADKALYEAKNAGRNQVVLA